MKKLLIAAMLLTSIPATAAYAFIGDCSSWSVVYARQQPQCMCRQVRNRGGRIVWTCN